MQKVKFKNLVRLFILLIIFSNISIMIGSPSMAEERVQSINITSQKMEVVKDKSLIVFTGDVVAVKEDMTIFSDELHIYYDEEGKEVKKMFATGNVRIEQEQGTATAQKAEYDRIEERIVLTGDPEFKECQNVVEGEKIVIYLREGRSVVESSEDKKVRAVLFPDSEEDKGRDCP